MPKDVANITTVQGDKKGGSLRTTIPKALANALKIRKKDKLEWIMDRGDLVIRKLERSNR